MLKIVLLLTFTKLSVACPIILDKFLTPMNKKNIQMYRILVDFGGVEHASVLPSILKRA